jgi:outer membrane lipoprotein-sorting protein
VTPGWRRSRRRLPSGAWIALISLLALAGCARALPPPRQAISAPAAQALARLVERWSEFRDFRALAEIDVRRRNDHRRFLAVVLLQAPASIRIEALSPLGQPVFVGVVHDRRVVVYDAVANAATVGPATSDTAARLLNLAIEPDDLVGILAGRPAPVRDLRLAEVGPADGGEPALLAVGRDHQQRLRMDFATGVVRELELTGGLYEVRVAYERTTDGSLAGLTLEAPRAGLSASVRYRDSVLNGGLDPDRFALTLPDTARVTPLR